MGSARPRRSSGGCWRRAGRAGPARPRSPGWPRLAAPPGGGRLPGQSGGAGAAARGVSALHRPAAGGAERPGWRRAGIVQRGAPRRAVSARPCRTAPAGGCCAAAGPAAAASAVPAVRSQRLWASLFLPDLIYFFRSSDAFAHNAFGFFFFFCRSEAFILKFVLSLTHFSSIGGLSRVGQ